MGITVMRKGFYRYKDTIILVNKGKLICTQLVDGKYDNIWTSSEYLGFDRSKNIKVFIENSTQE